MSDALVPLAADPGVIDQAADPGQFVVLACERAKAWLVQAVEQGDIENLVEIKSQAEAIRVYTAQKQIGHDAELAAAEICRRAERGIGLAIRRGQESGEIRRRGEPGSWGNQHGKGALTHEAEKASPAEYFSNHAEQSDAYAMADDVSDEEFDQALDEAKAEENLSRANMVRKVKGEPNPTPKNGADKSRQAVREREKRLLAMVIEGHNTSQIAAELGITEKAVKNIAKRLDVEILADKLIGRTRRIDPNRVIEETVLGLDAQATALSLMDGRWAAVDTERVDGWVSSLTDSLRLLNRFLKQLRELTP